MLRTADGGVRELPSKVTTTMRAGDRIAHVQPGGGGFGDPLERDAALVLRDVYDEQITAEYARREPGGTHGACVAPHGHIGTWMTR